MSAAPKQPRVVSGLGLGAGPSLRGKLPRVIGLDPRTYDRALSCVRCGLCLPACPTYTQDGLEADSPRGRIALMKGLADGRIDASHVVLRHLDLCLDCRACETACPSGVIYHELIEETRERLFPQRRPGKVDRLIRAFNLHVLAFPQRLKWALLPVRVLQKLGLWGLLCRVKLSSPKLDKMRRMLPRHGPLWERRLEEAYPPQRPEGPRNLAVGYFAGCVSSVLEQEVNRQAIALLCRTGCQVIVPRAQGCCGAIHYHAGGAEQARVLARANLDAFLPVGAGSAATPPPRYIVTGVAGCGAMLKDYAHLLRDDPEQAARAASFVHRVRDISQALVELRLPRPEHRLEIKATYHDACHLAHAQGVTDAPRQLLAMIPGLELIPLPESDMCCGAAGTYNLQEPEMARELALRKLRQIQATGAQVVIAANIGCAMQIRSEAQRLGVDLEVVHPVTLLYRAVFGPDAG